VRWGQKEFLAVENGRVEVVSVRYGVRSTGDKVNCDGPLQHRMRFVIEVWIRQKGQARSVRPELHNVEFSVDAVSFGYRADEICEIARLANWRFKVEVHCRR
jgi:hypothetical protein